MSLMKRRYFLQLAGSTLASIGLSQVDFLRQADRYGQVLAQETPRKLALLVGINNYPTEVSSLRGCVTDVRLQKHLLIHRFGFNPNDILEVSDDVAMRPTRENILTAFEEHLIKQAKPGDVVVLHYSGHGDRIRDPNPLNTAECQEIGDCELNGTIVPNDATIERRGSEVIVPDIMGRTLFLMMKQIDTENLTVILDSCHSGAGTRGVRVRAANARARAGTDEILVPSAAELQKQAELRSQLNLSERQFQELRQLGIAKGVAIGSAQRDQLAIDAEFSGFSAGAFTYLLTRYLWQVTRARSAESLYADLERSTRSLSQQQSDRVQVPTFDYQPNRNHQQQPIFFTDLATLPAEAVLTSTNPIQFWLGGVASQNLRGTGVGNVFSVIDRAGNAIAAIEQTRRVGLDGEGCLLEGELAALQVGMLMRERIVSIPANPTLKVGVDDSLGEAAAATRTELAAVSRVEAIDPPREVDYLIGRFTEIDQQQALQAGLTNLPPVGSIGLFERNLTPLTNSFGRIGESAIAALNRLRPRFKQLLARQLLGQLLMAGSGSPLRVEVKVFAEGDDQNSVQMMSRGASEARSQLIATGIPQFRSGSNVKIEVHNLEPQDLYLSVLVIGADGVMDVLYPVEWVAPEEAARISRSDRLTIPRPQDEIAFTIEGVGGFPELLILVSKEPLRQALSAMQSIARGRGQSRGVLGGLQDNEPIDVLDQLLDDLDNFSRSGNLQTGGVRTRRTNLVYNTESLAMLSAIFEVVA